MLVMAMSVSACSGTDLFLDNELLDRRRFPIVVIGARDTGYSCEDTLLEQCDMENVFRIHSLALRASIAAVSVDARRHLPGQLLWFVGYARGGMSPIRNIDPAYDGERRQEED